MSSTTPEICVQDDVTIIALGPEYENLDEHLLDHLREVMLETAQAANPPKVLLDLSHTKFFGSAFIEILFRLSNRVKSRKGKFAICGLTSYCAEVLAITHLDRLWPIYPTRSEAVKAMQQTPV